MGFLGFEVALWNVGNPSAHLAAVALSHLGCMEVMECPFWGASFTHQEAPPGDFLCVLGLDNLGVNMGAHF